MFLSMGVFDRTKFQGSFGVDQVSPWMFSMRLKVLQAHPRGMRVLSVSLESGRGND